MAGLSPVRAAVRFVGGIETKADGKTVPTTRLLGLENGVFTRALSIAKRHGYDALSKVILGDTAQEYGEVRGLGARLSEVVLFTSHRAYSYVDGAEKWRDTGAVASVTQSDRPLPKVTAAQTYADYAASNGVGLCAWEDSRGGVYFAVIDDDSGATLQTAQVSATAERPRCVRVGTKLAILWAEAALGQIKTIIFDPAAPQSYDKIRYPIVLTNDLSTTRPHFDAEYAPADADGVWTIEEAAALVWNSVTGIRFGFLDHSGVIGGPGIGYPSVVTLTGVVACECISVAVCPWVRSVSGVAYGDGANAYASKLTSTPSGINVDIALTSLGLIDGDAIATAWRQDAQGATLDCYVESRGVITRNSTITRVALDGSAVVGAATTIPGTLASRAFTDERDPISNTPEDIARVHTYVSITRDTPLFDLYLTIRWDGVVVARSMPGIASGAWDAGKPHLPSVITDEDRVYRWAAIVQTALKGINDDQYTEPTPRLIRLDFDDPTSHQSVVAGRTLYLGAANPLLYDGQAWGEANFHYAPDWNDGEVLHVNSAAAGGLVAGTRNYVFVPEVTLANGEILRGPASRPYTVVLGGGVDTTTLTIPNIHHTSWDARIAVYRTIAGDTSAYYRCSSLDPTLLAPGDANGYLKNVTTGSSVTFVDKMSDDTLDDQEPLYTDGGILSNDPVPGAHVIASTKNRLFGTDPSDGSIVRFSQERAEGYAIEWPPELVIRLDPYGGDVTGIASIDSTLIIFKRSAIYAVSGPGPLANPEAGGPGDGFTPSQLVTTDVGCISQRSIASTPAGVIFKSAKGIYLLDRSLQVTYVGAPVEAYNDQDVVRATLVDDTTQVRILTSSGRTLLFDYTYGAWSTWTNHEGVDAVVADGVYQYLRNDGRVFRENASSYADAGQRIPLVIETAWIRFDESLQGYARFWHMLVLGTWKSPHTLRFQYALGYARDGDWSNPVDIDCSSMGGASYGSGPYGEGDYGGTSSDAYQHSIHIGQTGQALRARFADLEDAGGDYGASFELTELLLDGGVKAPTFRPHIPETRRS